MSHKITNTAAALAGATGQPQGSDAAPSPLRGENGQSDRPHSSHAAGFGWKRKIIDRLLRSGVRPVEVARTTGFDHCYIKERSRKLGLKQPRVIPSPRRLVWSAEMLAALEPLIAGTASISDAAAQIGVAQSALIGGLIAKLHAERAQRAAA